MSMLSGVCWTAKRDFLMGVHQPGDRYKIALYGANANLNPMIETYTSSGEVSGNGYEKGGQLLRGYSCDLDGATGVLNWREAPLWRNATIRAQGALIYNASRGNRAIVVIAFNEEVSSTNGDYRLPMPAMTAADALVRIT